MAKAAEAPGHGSRDVLVTSGVFEPGFRGGGPARSLAHLVDNAPETVDITVVTIDRDLGAARPYVGLSGQLVRRGRIHVFYLSKRNLAHWTRLLAMIRRKNYSLLYVNSFWSPTTTIVPVVAALLRIIHVDKILVAPRGELAEGALGVRKVKKKVFLAVWKHTLQKAEVEWHATAQHEARDIRRYFPGGVVHVFPNQVSLPADPLPPLIFPGRRARLVFLSRIVAVKNLDMALKGISGSGANIDLDIYGPTEDKHYWASCKRLIRQMPANVDVTYRGEVHPTEVQKIFSRYDAFLFPTGGENFGHVIAESLSASCPVICSDRTPWTDTLRTAGGGVVLRHLSAEVIAAEVARISKSSPEKRHAARLAAGRAYSSWRRGLDDGHIFGSVLPAPE